MKWLKLLLLQQNQIFIQNYKFKKLTQYEGHW